MRDAQLYRAGKLAASAQFVNLRVDNRHMDAFFERDDASNANLVMCMILYSEFAVDAVHTTLDNAGVAGFTELAKVTGRGPRGQHFDTHVWPGYDGMIYCVVGAEQSETLVEALAGLNASLEQNSRGSRGLHVFTWDCPAALVRLRPKTGLSARPLVLV